MKALTNNLERILATILVALLLMSMVPVSAYAAEGDTVVEVTCDGNPVADAEISLKADGIVLVSGTSDSSGKAMFDSDQLSGMNTCAVSATGYSPAEVAATAPGTIRVELTAITTGMVTGVVRNSEGKSVGAASVSLVGYATYSAETDVNGYFSISDVYDTGTYQLTVTAGGYKTVTQDAVAGGNYKITLDKKESIDLTFEKDTVTVAMGTTETNAVSNSGGRAVSYTSEDTSVVTVDPSTGVLTPVNIGQTRINAVCSEDGNYLESTGSYPVDVVKGMQSISFQNGSTPELILKTPSTEIPYSNPATAEGTKTYSVISGADLLKDFNPDDGSFTVIKTGEITIQVYVEDSNFDDASASYVLTVKKPFEASDAFTIEGTKRNNSGWYVSDVYLKAVDGYTLSYTTAELNDLLGYGSGTTELLVTNLSSAGATPNGVLDAELVIKRYDGAIIETTVQDIKKDSGNPEVTLTVEEKSEWDQFLYIISMSGRNKQPAIMTITAKDNHSNVDKIQYYFAEGTDPLSFSELESLPDESWKDYSATVPVDPGQLTTDGQEVETTSDAFFTAYTRVFDIAGNVVYANSNGIILDTTKPTVTITDENENELDPTAIYTENLTLKVVANDGEKKSGIKSVDYWIEAQDLALSGEGTSKVTAKNLFTAEDSTVAGVTGVLTENLVDSWDGEIVIDAQRYNSSYVILNVSVTDRAENETVTTIDLDFDKTAPAIAVNYGECEAVEYDGVNYFTGIRSFVVTITERANHFDADAASSKIVVTAKDASGADVADAWTIDPWVTARADQSQFSDQDTHTTTVRFNEDANYTFAISYTDNAGLENNPTIVKTGKVQGDSFVIDTTAPTGTLRALGKTWDSLLSTLTFGLYSNKTTEIKASFNDATSPVKSYEYFFVDATQPLTESEISAITWAEADISAVTKGSVFEIDAINPDRKQISYARITDAAGNSLIISSDGVTIENDASSITIQAVTAPNGNAIYNKSVEMAVAVLEPSNSGVHSGISNVVWWTESEGVSGEGSASMPNTLYTFERTPQIDYDDLAVEWNGSCTVDAAKNNSNAVKLCVRTTDNAGNSTLETYNLKIDVTAPAIKLETPSGYLNSNQTVTITISERNFDPDKVTITATKNGKNYTVKPTWTDVAGTGNGDDTKHVGTIQLSEDGNYSIKKISCTDLADNTTTMEFTNAFTIDKTDPFITVAYDNNNVTNGNYYDAARVATITVVDANFDAGTAVISASDNGRTLGAPGLSPWVSKGDTHVATVTFSEDAHYTFSINCRDKAGNTANRKEPDFFVDKTKPYVEIRGIADKSANNTEGNIGFTLTATDANMDVFVPKVVSVTLSQDGRIEKGILEYGVITDIVNGKQFVVENVEQDGIYKVSCTVVDKAGNAYSSVYIVGADGKTATVEKTAKDELLTFSVNRNGSTFDLDDNTLGVVNNYYVQNVYHDVVIREINVDKIEKYQVSLGNKALKEGTDFKVTKEGGGDEWTCYTYTVDRTLFDNEGEYNLVVSSTDTAKNNAFSDIKGAGVSFVVDRTAPKVAVSGMQSGGRYQTELQTVTIIPTDDGGKMASLHVALVDSKGNTEKELIALSGKELDKALEENEGIFTIELQQGLYQNVRILCTDCAVDEQGAVNTYDETFKNVSVSSSGFMIFWANKPMRYGIMIGALALIGATGVVIRRVRRKRGKVQDVLTN